MARPPVEVTVGGQVYRLVASAGEQTLQRCAQVVDQRLGRPVGQLLQEGHLLQRLLHGVDKVLVAGRQDDVAGRGVCCIRPNWRRISTVTHYPGPR